MNILLTTFFHNGISFSVFYDHMCRWFINNLPQDCINIKFIVTEPFWLEVKSNELYQKYNPIYISNEELRYIVDSNNISYNKIIDYRNKNREIFNCKLKEIFDNKCQDFTPDIIFSQAAIDGGKIWGDIFPQALCLSNENAIFSRPPFRRTLSFDPFNAAPYNFLTKFSDEINNFKISEEQNKKIEQLKHSLTELIDKNSPLDDDVYCYKKRFDKLLLFPLIGDKYIILFDDCICNTELELVEYVMQKIPQNIGVFVTQADAYASLTQDKLEYLRNKYSNFIYLQKTDKRGFANNSLHYFKYIDGILNITSKTAFMALLWNKPVISLAKTYNNWLKDAQDIQNIEEVLNNPIRNKNNILYWYFTRYVIFEQDFYRHNFLWNYINTKLNKYREEGINYNYFEEINSIDKVYYYIMMPIIDYYDNIRKSISYNEKNLVK